MYEQGINEDKKIFFVERKLRKALGCDWDYFHSPTI